MCPRRITVRLGPELKESLRRRARLTGSDESAVVRAALEQYLRHPPGAAPAFEAAKAAGLIGAAKSASRDAFETMKKLGGNMKYTELAGVGHNAWVQAFEYKGDNPAKGYVTHYATDRCDRTPDVWQWLFAQRKP